MYIYVSYRYLGRFTIRKWRFNQPCLTKNKWEIIGMYVAILS